MALVGLSGDFIYYKKWVDEKGVVDVYKIGLKDGKTTPLYRLGSYSSQSIHIGGDYIFFYDDHASDHSKIDILKVKKGENKVEKLGPKAK